MKRQVSRTEPVHGLITIYSHSSLSEVIHALVLDKIERKDWSSCSAQRSRALCRRKCTVLWHHWHSEPLQLTERNKV